LFKIFGAKKHKFLRDPPVLDILSWLHVETTLWRCPFSWGYLYSSRQADSLCGALGHFGPHGVRLLTKRAAKQILTIHIGSLKQEKWRFNGDLMGFNDDLMVI
jgi:hypothetical protein